MKNEERSNAAEKGMLRTFFSRKKNNAPERLSDEEKQAFEKAFSMYDSPSSDNDAEDYGKVELNREERRKLKREKRVNKKADKELRKEEKEDKKEAKKDKKADKKADKRRKKRDRRRKIRNEAFEFDANDLIVNFKPRYKNRSDENGFSPFEKIIDDLSDEVCRNPDGIMRKYVEDKIQSFNAATNPMSVEDAKTILKGVLKLAASKRQMLVERIATSVLNGEASNQFNSDFDIVSMLHTEKEKQFETYNYYHDEYLEERAKLDACKDACNKNEKPDT